MSRRSKGSGSVVERSPGVWRVRVYAGKDPVTGHPRQVERTVHGSRRKAEDMRRLLEQEIGEGKHKGTRGTVAHLLEAWDENKGGTPLTLDNRRRIMRLHLIPALGERQLSSLSAFDLDEYYRQKTAEGLGPGTVRQHHKILSAALNQAVKWEWIGRNPAVAATPPQPPKRVNRAPDPTTVRALIDICDHDPVLAAAIIILGITGIRRGELCGLRWSDVDWDKQLLQIERQRFTVTRKDYTGPPKTGSRPVSLGDGGIAILRRHLGTVLDTASRLGVRFVNEDSWLLSYDGGRTPIRPGALSKAITAAGRRAGAKVTPKLLRYFAATQMVGAGVDIRTAAERLGHDPAVMLKVYADSLPARDLEAAQGLESLVLSTTNIPATGAGTDKEREQ